MDLARRLGCAHVIMLASLNCGPPLPSDGDSGASGGTSSEVTTGESTSSESTSDESTSDESTSDESTGDSTDTTGEPPTEPYYIAYTYIGGYDRLIIRKVDPLAVRCTSIQLVIDGNATVPAEIAISTPQNWSVERISLEPNLDGCLGPNTLLPPGFDASAGVGAVTWEADGWPEVIDVDVTLTFVQDEPWKPAEELLSVTGLVVDP